MREPRLRRPTPREEGFRWPAEWEKHEATWLAWPHDPLTWPDCVEEAEAAFATMAAAIGAGETVHVLVKDADTETRARARLSAAGARRVVLHRIPTADSWFRDYGPIVVVKGRGRTRERLALDFRFNAWGGKYPSLIADDAIPRRLVKIHGVSARGVEHVLEGGSIEGNGRGTLLTTEQCLLHPNRNPHLTRFEVEALLRETLGVRHVLWLGEGIAGDDTDGHVDDVARFVDARTVVAVRTDDPDDPDHAPLEDNWRRLQAMADQDGEPLRAVALPSPGPVLAPDGRRLPASYANFYVCNTCVLVPTFGRPTDATALKVLQRCFPAREVVAVRCDRLVEGMGALHCVTQQLPA
jgi:agmatine deiminase